MFNRTLHQGITGETLEGLKRELEGLGIHVDKPYSRGTTSIVFIGEAETLRPPKCMGNEKRVIIKLARLDSPRDNLKKEAMILKALEPYCVTPPLIHFGRIGERSYLVRWMAEGSEVRKSLPEKGHIFQIVEKTALLDKLGLDHGQIQGGKHIIIGRRVWLIDFEKANWRKTKNLTSAMAMLFIGDNSISRRVKEHFGVDVEFLEDMRKTLKIYKERASLIPLLELLSSL